MKVFAGLAVALLAAGCVSSPTVQQRPEPVIPRAPVQQSGVGGVMGQNARALMAFFGKPVLDVREFNARKLQFSSGTCVLDAYLYPQRKGAEPVVTHIDTRLPDGRDTDRAACIAALNRQR